MGRVRVQSDDVRRDSSVAAIQQQLPKHVRHAPRAPLDPDHAMHTLSKLPSLRLWHNVIPLRRLEVARLQWRVVGGSAMSAFSYTPCTHRLTRFGTVGGTSGRALRPNQG